LEPATVQTFYFFGTRHRANLFIFLEPATVQTFYFFGTPATETKKEPQLRKPYRTRHRANLTEPKLRNSKSNPSYVNQKVTPATQTKKQPYNSIVHAP
jgi:hypothetical protein